MYFLTGMPEYRITFKLRMGETKTGVRHYPRHDMEGVRAYFEKKVYEKYSKYLVESISVEKIREEEGKKYEEMGF